MTNPFANAAGGRGWEWPVGMMSLVLGVMLSLAWIGNSNRQSRIRDLDPDIAVRLTTGQVNVDEFQNLSTEVRRLQQEATAYEKIISEGGDAAKTLNQSLQNLKIYAGLTSVEGPGITVTLRDSTKEAVLADNDKIIHDLDVLRVVNELWAAGAEAIEINGDRLSVGSSIRCVGPVIHVDGKPVASPVMVRAIGNVDTLMGAIELPGGALSEIRETDAAMVEVDRVKLHRFKAHTGSQTREYVKAVEDKK